MPGKRVLILHGFEHERGPEHWLWWITQRLRDFDVPVQYPQLPNPFRPVLKDWVNLAKAELELLGDGERIVITHSLGCVLWSLLVDQGHVRGDESVLMVAPPSRDRLDGVLAPFDAALGPEYIDTTGVVLVGRERDRYRNTKLDWLDAGRASEVHILPGEGHLNPDDGHGPFPEALEWVLTGRWPA